MRCMYKQFIYVLLALCGIICLSWHPYYPKFGKHDLKGKVKIVIKTVDNAGSISLEVKEYYENGFIKEIRLYDIDISEYYTDGKFQLDSIAVSDTSELILGSVFRFSYTNTDKLQSFEKIYYNSVYDTSYTEKRVVFLDSTTKADLNIMTDSFIMYSRKPHVRRNDLIYPYFIQNYRQRIEYRYDENDSLSEEVETRIKPDGIDISYTNYKYIHNENTIREIRIENDNDTIYDEIFYFNNNRIFKSETLKNKSSCSSETFTYKYDENGDLSILNISRYPGLGCSDCKDEYYSFIRDREGNVIHRSYIRIGSLDTLSYNSSIIYDSNGKIDFMITKWFDSVFLSSIAYYKMNQKDDYSWCNITDYYIRGDSLRRSISQITYEYIYDSKDNWLVKKEYEKDKLSSIERRIIVYY